MTSKIHIRAGDVELSLENDSPLAAENVKELIDQVHEIAKSILLHSPVKISKSAPDAVAGNGQNPVESSNIQLHVNSVAERLDAKTGPELVISSAAYLQIVEGKKSFSRKELLDTMKSATNHYNQNMGSNLSSSIKTLTSTKLNQLANDSYSLKSSELTELRAKLAD